jgi:F-type H+-transporting ATPase subunit delta
MANEGAATQAGGRADGEDLRDLRLPRVYAKAMLDLAVAQNQADDLLGELSDLARTVAGDPGLATFLASPLVTQRQRGQVLEKVFRGRGSDLLVDSLEVINQKGRLDLLVEIAEAYRREYRELRGLVDARVTTAVPLAAAQRQDLVAAIAGFTGKRPDLIERVDPAILGGIVIEVAGEKIDSSLATRLQDVGALLAARAAKEIHGGASMVEGT